MRQVGERKRTRFISLFGLWRQRIGGFFTRTLERLEPAASRRPWIRRGVLVGLLFLGGWIGAESLTLPFGIVADIGLGMLIALLLIGLAQLLLGPGLGLIRLLARLWTPGGLVGVVAAMLLLVLVTLSLPLAMAAGLVVGLAFVVAGLGIGLLRTDPRRPVAAGMCLLAAALVIGSALVWLMNESAEEDPVRALVGIAQHDGQPWDQFLETGPYQTGFLTYGSGTDRWRGEYGDQVAWASSSVDARDLLGRPSGFGLRLRERWWGFGLDALPVNGRVWYPLEARGRVPLVLVVHGNHDMMDYSDPGYAWLGEHLASRGHVVVSVDQNFINGGMFGDVSRENGVRGWLLLKHLEAWRQWQNEPEHALHEQVDLERVVLIGHSRGGEAAALAAAFNRLELYPEDARIAFDFDFGIQGVAAIAPVDGQFQASGKPTELADVSYFVIHGGMDGDVYLFLGDRQLVRTRPDPAAGRFSASLYVHHANHGQFNTAWGDNDTGMIAGRVLNRAGLMAGEAQRRVGLLYLTAFVESALARPTDMPALFCDPGMAGRLLPETLYVARCDDGRRVLLADFEQGIDITRSSLDGVSLQGIDLDLWAERDVGFRGTSQRQQTGVFLGWHAAKEDARNDRQPAYRIHLEPSVHDRLVLGADSELWLDLAQADRDPPRADNGDANDEDATSQPDESEENPLRPHLKIALLLTDADGNHSSRPLADFARLLPPLPVRHTRLDAINRKRYHSATEPLLQSVAIPLAAFIADGLRPDRLETIEFQFDNTDAGVLIIERIGITPGWSKQN